MNMPKGRPVTLYEREQYRSVAAERITMPRAGERKMKLCRLHKCEDKTAERSEEALKR